jgi:hypothetical protein
MSLSLILLGAERRPYHTAQKRGHPTGYGKRLMLDIAPIWQHLGANLRVPRERLDLSRPRVAQFP